MNTRHKTCKPIAAARVLRGLVLPALLMSLVLCSCVVLPGEWVSDLAGDGGASSGAPAESRRVTVGSTVATNDNRTAPVSPAVLRPADESGLSDAQVRILAAAQEMLETQQFVVEGYRYSYDCTGTILAIYAMAGIRLVDLFPAYTGNGVQRLYGIADDRNLLYTSNRPQPGDLIFWDNTYDKNGDKEWNDWLTHVGLVLGVGEDGSIDYLHHHYTDGVVRARMNLTDPQTHMGADGVIVNSPMRMRSHRYLNPDVWLASHLYRTLGAMHLIQLASR